MKRADAVEPDADWMRYFECRDCWMVFYFESQHKMAILVEGRKARGQFDAG